MAHDRASFKVSHYADSPSWRASVMPAGGGYVLFEDLAGAPQLYLASEVQDGGGITETTYEPCVRAMSRSAAEAQASDPIPMVPFTIRVLPDRDSGSIFAFCASAGSVAGGGATPREAVSALLDLLSTTPAVAYADRADDAPPPAVLSVRDTVRHRAWLALKVEQVREATKRAEAQLAAHDETHGHPDAGALAL